VPAPARPGIGAAVAKLQIPSIGLDWTVVEGVSTPALAKGPGHFPESRLPGQLGNAALAGHRTTHGAPFGDLDRLQDGDQIIVTTLAGRYVYLVTGRTIVSPDEYGKVIPTTDPTTATLVLATCHPKWTSSQRLIIFAVLDASGSSPLTAPSAAGAPSTGSIPGDDSASTSATPSTGPGSTAPAGTAGSATTVATGGTSAVGSTGSDTTIADAGPTGPADTSVVDAAAGPDTTEAAPSDASSQAFGGGWFDDPDAWPHVIAWGLLLIAIWVGAYRLAKRFRRLWLGILVGFAPFVVVLYFWFENVNRLLPPNL
jgi:sortase A